MEWAGCHDQKSWGGHTWNTEELTRLFAGEEVSVNGLISSKGSTYGVKGKLTEQTYKGKNLLVLKLLII